MFAVKVGSFLAASVLLFAQDPRGSIAGRVVDQSDAVVVGARVQATNVQTGVVAGINSNETGTFRIPFLVPGTYRLTVEMRGFKTYSQPALDLRTGDALDIAIRLDVGDTTERVDVSAAAPILETGSSTLGQVIDERRLLELPQKGGDPFELMRLVPGVVNLTTLRTMKSSSPEGTSQISVNGSGVDQAQFQIDGINDTTNDTGKNYARVAFIPPSDAIVEFKMQANPYDASAGHVLGPISIMSPPRAATTTCGNLYYWFKNSVFDAPDFFVNKAGQKEAAFSGQSVRPGGGRPGCDSARVQRPQQDLLLLCVGREPFRQSVHHRRADQHGPHAGRKGGRLLRPAGAGLALSDL